jgi:hypothetical protein
MIVKERKVGEGRKGQTVDTLRPNYLMILFITI